MCSTRRSLRSVSVATTPSLSLGEGDVATYHPRVTSRELADYFRGLALAYETEEAEKLR
jgi:hypothetical protein